MKYCIRFELMTIPELFNNIIVIIIIIIIIINLPVLVACLLNYWYVNR